MMIIIIRSIHIVFQSNIYDLHASECFQITNNNNS